METMKQGLYCSLNMQAKKEGLGTSTQNCSVSPTKKEGMLKLQLFQLIGGAQIVLLGTLPFERPVLDYVWHLPAFT